MQPMSNAGRTIVVPALIISLGRLCHEAAWRVEALLARAGDPRAPVTRCLALGPGIAGEPSLLAASAAVALGVPADTRRAGADAVFAHAAALRERLRAALLDLRTDGRLSRAGLADVAAPPLDVIVLADATEPWASGAMLPLAYLLQDLLAHEVRGLGHLVLNVGSFASGEQAEAVDLQVFAMLQELDGALGGLPKPVGGRLAAALHVDRVEPLAAQVFLFDRRKEGTREVQDAAELGRALSSFVLALLSGGLAQRLSYNSPPAERGERRGFYSGGAAGVVVFEPGPLIDACSARLGADWIAAELAAGPADAETVDALDRSLGEERDWLRRLHAGVPCEVLTRGREWRLNWRFTDLGFDRVPREAWAARIEACGARFARTSLPRVQRLLAESAVALSATAGAALSRATAALPRSTRDGPGGLQAARDALRLIDGRLEARRDAIAAGAPVPPDLDEALRELDRVAGDFPDLPAVVARVVLLWTLEVYSVLAVADGLRERWPDSAWVGPAAAVALVAVTLGLAVLWFRCKDGRLLDLRERCVCCAEQRSAALLELQTRRHLLAICDELRAGLERAAGDLDRLQIALRAAHDELVERWNAYLTTALDWPRAPARAPLARWAYQQWQPPAAGLRRRWLEDHRLLADRTASAVDLQERVLAAARETYAPAAAITVEEALARAGDGPLEPPLLALARETVPLLRPNFDRCAADCDARALSYLLVRDAEAPVVASLLDGPLSDWDAARTGDPHLLAFCRVRPSIGLPALATWVQNGASRYRSLPPEQRAALHLFDAWVGDAGRTGSPLGLQPDRRAVIVPLARHGGSRP